MDLVELMPLLAAPMINGTGIASAMYRPEHQRASPVGLRGLRPDRAQPRS